MKTQPKTTGAATGLKVNRFLASLRAEGSDRPHPAVLAVAKQPRAARKDRLRAFLRIDRGIGA